MTREHSSGSASSAPDRWARASPRCRAQGRCRRAGLRADRGAGRGGPRPHHGVAGPRRQQGQAHRSASATRRWPGCASPPTSPISPTASSSSRRSSRTRTSRRKIFAELDEVVTDPDAVLASNTSSIPIMKIAAATKNPSRVLGLHFFNPVPVLPLVELVSTLVTTRRGRRRAPSSSRARCSASRWCAAPTAPASSSTRCWCPTCCRRSAWSSPASPPWKTSTRPSSPGWRTRWARCGCPT